MCNKLIEHNICFVAVFKGLQNKKIRLEKRYSLYTRYNELVTNRTTLYRIDCIQGKYANMLMVFAAKCVRILPRNMDWLHR